MAGWDGAPSLTCRALGHDEEESTMFGHRDLEIVCYTSCFAYSD